MSRNSTFLRRIYRLPTITNNFFLIIRLLWQVFIKSQAKRRPLAKSPFTMKLGAGTAFESVVAHYERAELPHTLPCHKIFFHHHWFSVHPQPTIYTNIIYLLSLYLPPFIYLLFIFLSVARIILAARISHHRFIKGMLIWLCYLKNTIYYTDIYYFVQIKVIYFCFF
jgi:hypothetical protein